MSNLSVENALVEMLDELGKSQFSLPDSLRVIAESASVERLRRTASELFVDMQRGSLFSNALAKNQSTDFSLVFISLMAIGEQVGSLSGILSFLHKEYAQRRELKERLAGVLAYPILLLLVVMLGTSVLLFAALPSFIHSGLIEQDAESFRFIFFINFLPVLSLTILLLVLLTVWICWSFRLDTAALVFKTLTELSAQGYALNICLMLVASLVNAAYFGRDKEKIRTVLIYLEQGHAPSQAFKASGFLDVQGSFLLKISELQGDCAAAFAKMSSYYEKKQRTSQKLCLQLLEPLILLIMGVFILGLIQNLVMPLLASFY